MGGRPVTLSTILRQIWSYGLGSLRPRGDVAPALALRMDAHENTQGKQPTASRLKGARAAGERRH